LFGRKAGCARGVNVLDEKLSDGEIRELWAENFPKRHDDAKAKAICMLLCGIVERRAAYDAINAENALVQVQRLLITIGIPREEFYQVERETHDE
jgi:hypothetical protein